MEIFKLVGSVLVDTAEANQSLSKVDEKAEGTGKKFSDVAGGIGKSALAIGTAVVGAGAALYSMADSAAQTADEIDKGSIRMGVSTEAYQEFKYAAGQCGVEMTVLEKAAKQLEGTDINFDDAMSQIMALGTAEERSAKACELFGEMVAYKMSPLIEQSADSYNGLIDNAHNLGIIMSEDSVAAGVLMGDTMSDIKQSITAVGTQIGSAFMPVIQDVLEWVIENMPEIQATVGDVIDFVVNLIKELMPVIEALTPLVKEVFGIVKVLWDTVLQPVLMFIINFLTDVFQGNWQKIWDNIKGVVTSIVDSAKNWGKDLIDNFINGIKEKWEDLKETVSKVAETVKDFLGFSEPKKGPLSNFHTFAPDMMDLYAEGIKENKYKVTEQVEGLAGNIATSAKTANITLTTPVYLDGRIIASVVNQQLGVML